MNGWTGDMQSEKLTLTLSSSELISHLVNQATNFVPAVVKKIKTIKQGTFLTREVEKSHNILKILMHLISNIQIPKI